MTDIQIENLITNKELIHLAKLYEAPYINFINSPEYYNRNNLFKDAAHLNDCGAYLFTLEIAKLLNSRRFNELQTDEIAVN